MPTESKLDPFLKWAGGKRWLTTNHSELFPKKFNRYIEPFLGSGAVFFHLDPKKSLLADSNPDLVETYNALKLDAKAVATVLRKHQRHHNNDYYYRVRNSEPLTPHTRAARFIYLNRTCWNGLYRVNKNGKFNVPIGTKTNILYDIDNFLMIQKRLSSATITCSDFEKTISQAKEGDLVFVDPPYTVKHNYNGFNKYNEKLFNWSDQTRLRDCLEEANDKGAILLITNADHESISKLYKGFGKKIILERNSVISGQAKFRGKYSELFIVCR